MRLPFKFEPGTLIESIEERNSKARGRILARDSGEDLDGSRMSLYRVYWLDLGMIATSRGDVIDTFYKKGVLDG